MELVKQIMEGKPDINEELLDEMLACSSCTDIGKQKVTNVDFDSMDIDELLKQLPGLEYVKGRMLNYMFSNGLTTGDDGQDQKLDHFLYEEMNKHGSTNYSVLRESIGEAAVYGECGLRMKDGALYSYHKGYYGILVYNDEGIDEIVAYFIRKDGERVEGKIDFDKVTHIQDIEGYFDKSGMILLDPSEFVNLRNETGNLHGSCPFLKDRQRLTLLLSVYDRLNYDISYDGPGRIILRPKDGFVAGENNEVSTGEVLTANKEKIAEKARQEAARVGREIKTSSSDSVIVLSNAFSDKIDKLPRVTKATEFFDWLTNETVIISQILGMSPTLLEVGKLHGNVSVEKIIDNAMLNTIIPMRENYAVQFSAMIASVLGISKVYFDKYDMQQVQDENDERKKLAQVIQSLAAAQKNSESEDVGKLVDEFTDYLRTSIYTPTNELKRF